MILPELGSVNYLETTMPAFQQALGRLFRILFLCRNGSVFPRCLVCI
jgi:hypothetical protein